MSNSKSTFEILANSVMDSLSTQNAVFLHADPDDKSTVKGKTLNGGETEYSYPQMQTGKRSLPGNPVALWFTKDDKQGKITFNFSLDVKGINDGTIAFPLSDPKVSLVVLDEDGKRTTKQAKVTWTNDPVIGGTVLLSLSEFSFLKKRLEDDFNQGENFVFMEWSAIAKWLPIGDYDAFFAEKESSKRSSMIRQFNTSGTLQLSLDYTDSHVYEGIRGVLCWEQEVIESPSGRYTIWFKDAMESNTYYFLPQIFRIKANPNTNAPEMSFALVRDPEANRDDMHSYRVRMNFEVVPYYHPRAERDLYRVIRKRSGGKVKICNIKYGGYESASFTVRAEESVNALFHKLGVKPMVEGQVTLSPDSSFNISIESSMDAFAGIRQSLLDSGIYIGDVVVKVTDGIDNKEREIKLETTLDLGKVARTNIGVKPLESDDRKVRFPHKVELKNNGRYLVEIGGCELSMISEKKDVGRDVVHELRTENAWPVVLASGETKVIKLHPDDVQKLNKKNKFLGINVRKYWSTLVCQPYSVHLRRNDLDGIIEDIEDHASSDLEMWMLEVVINFDWASLPDVEAVEVEVKNEEYAKDEVLRIRKGSESAKVNMCANITAIRQAQLILNRVFQYRIRAVLNNKVTEWTEFIESSGVSLYLFNKNISDLL